MATSLKHLQARAEAFQDYLELLKTSEYSRFNKVLRKLEQNLAGLLDAADGDLASVTRARLERLLRDMSKANKSALDTSVKDYLSRLESFSAYSYAMEGSTLASVSPRIADVLQLTKKKSAIFAEALKRPIGATGDLLEPFIRDISPRQVGILERTIRKAHANGMTAQEITKVIKGTRSKNYSDGVTQKLGRQTATVVRTSIQHVNNVARQVVWNENSDVVVGYRWVSTLDGKTSPVCQDRDGEIYVVGEGPIPPAHPNCRSTTIAQLSNVFDIFDRGATRSSEDGYVPADLTFHKWLEAA